MRLRLDYDIYEVHEMIFEPSGMPIDGTDKYAMSIYVSFNLVPGGEWDDEANVISGQIDISGLDIDNFEKAETLCMKLSDDVLVKGYVDLSGNTWNGYPVEII